MPKRRIEGFDLWCDGNDGLCIILTKTIDKRRRFQGALRPPEGSIRRHSLPPLPRPPVEARLPVRRRARDCGCEHANDGLIVTQGEHAHIQVELSTGLVRLDCSAQIANFLPDGSCWVGLPSWGLDRSAQIANFLPLLEPPI
jgi:hypothetical protein